MQKKKYQAYWYTFWTSCNLNLCIVHSSASNDLKLQTLRRLQKQQHHSTVSLQAVGIYPGTYSLSLPQRTNAFLLTHLASLCIMSHDSKEATSWKDANYWSYSTTSLMSMHKSWVTDLLNTNICLQNKECSRYMQGGNFFVPAPLRVLSSLYRDPEPSPAELWRTFHGFVQLEIISQHKAL